MFVLLGAGLTGAAVVAFVPAAVFAAECVLGVLPKKSGGQPVASGPRPRTAVLMPAHDEESGIEATLAALHPELGPADRLLVVADNCSDRTAEVARRAGAEVVERNDPERRGKGYALSYGISHLAASPPDVVVVVDADCRLSSGGIERLARIAVSTRRPVQAEYLMQTAADPDPRSLVSAFAFLVRNRVRPRGLARLGLPCHLTGTGMAFAWDVLLLAEAMQDHVVEDLAMGIDLALKGHAPLFCDDVQIESVLPERESAAQSQRRRWEAGQLSVLREFVPRLLARGIEKRDVGLIALGLDLAVPPLALLVAGLGAASVASLPVAALGGGVAPLLLFSVEAGLVGGAVFLSWARFGTDVLPPAKLAAIPRYIAWKIPMYASLLVRGRERAWVRTERD